MAGADLDRLDVKPRSCDVEALDPARAAGRTCTPAAELRCCGSTHWLLTTGLKGRRARRCRGRLRWCRFAGYRGHGHGCDPARCERVPRRGAVVAGDLAAVDLGEVAVHAEPKCVMASQQMVELDPPSAVFCDVLDDDVVAAAASAGVDRRPQPRDRPTSGTRHGRVIGLDGGWRHLPQPVRAGMPPQAVINLFIGSRAPELSGIPCIISAVSAPHAMLTCCGRRPR